MPRTAQFVTRQTGRLLDRLAHQAADTLHSSDADAVHDLRVAIRRFVQALMVWKPCFPSRERRKIRRDLKELMGFAGAVRDRDIARELLAGENSNEAAALSAKLQIERQEAAKVLTAVLGRWVARKSASKARSRLLPVKEEAESPEQILAPLAKKFFRAGDLAAEPHSSAAELHGFRVQAKKFRYSVELFQPVYGPIADEWLGKMKRLQKLLGDMNDYRVTREMVEELGAHGPLAASLKKKQQKKIEGFRELWRSDFAGTDKQWRRSFARSPRKPMARAAGSPVKKIARAL